MRPSAGNAVTPDPVLWSVLPPERRAAAVALLAMLAARAVARLAGGGRDEPGQVPAAGAAQQKIRPEHLDRAASIARAILQATGPERDRLREAGLRRAGQFTMGGDGRVDPRCLP